MISEEICFDYKYASHTVYSGRPALILTGLPIRLPEADWSITQVCNLTKSLIHVIS
jgi:hypothetical protein